MSEDFFITPQAEGRAILLIDASGSVLQPYPEPTAPATVTSAQKTVFEKMQEICAALPHAEFRLLFWNSDTMKTKFDTSGVLKIPFAVARDKLALNFKIAREQIDNSCLTMPHLAFGNIADWLQSGYSRTVYFVTDGLIGWDQATVFEKRQLADLLAGAIRSLVDKFRDVQLSIIAVERDARTDYGVIESMATVVGNDVFQAISNNRLTSMVTRFRSYTPRHAAGYDHIDRGMQTPTGFVPFGRRGYFSPLSTPQFIKFIAAQVAAVRENEDALLKIVQDLSPTLAVLTRDKPERVRAKTLEIFCRLFDGTLLDASTVQFLLQRAVGAEACGSAQLYAEYRANLKNLYANAGKMLRDDAAQAMSLGERTMTLPLPLSNGKQVILVSDSHTPDQPVLGHANGAYRLDGHLVPVVPRFISPSAGLMVKQCVRQWLRLLLSHQYKIHQTSDEIILLMMTINLQVHFALLNNNSPLANDVRRAYADLVTALLEKKRLNSQATELEQLLAGNLFVPNDGNVEQFTRFLQNAAARLGLATTSGSGGGGSAKGAVEPLCLWYYLCLAHSQRLADSQLVHCRQYIGAAPTMADIGQWPLPTSNVVVHQLPEQLDYTCLITMESTSATGGLKFIAHRDAMGNVCSPRQVLSTGGVDQLLANPATSLCPICYSGLTRDNFAAQPPLASAVAAIAEFDPALLATDGIFATAFASSGSASNSGGTGGGSSNSGGSGNSGNSGNSSDGAATSATMSAPPAPAGPPRKATAGTLVVLCGTVGCGKSTFAAKLQRLEEAAGKYCLVTGSDKFVAQGVSMGPPAVARVKQELTDAQFASNAAGKIVIIDACNEHFQKNNVFGVDFSNWRIERVWVNLDRARLSQYLAWSLRNVAQRKAHEAVLTPGTAGLAVCIKVHLKKARALFGNKTAPIAPEHISLDALVQQISPEADEYLRYLQSNEEKYAPKAF